MKKTLYSLLLSALALSSLNSCGDDFLDKTPKDSYTADNFYNDPAALKTATAPLYCRAWFDYSNRTALALGSCRANDGYGQWFLPEYSLFTATALHEEVANAWKGCYSVVSMANETIKAIEEKTKGVSEAQKNAAIAECRLMRGLAYFYLVRLWGSVILYEDNTVVVKNPVQPRHKEEDVLKFIIRDFEYASKWLPENAEKGRASSWAAKGLLAKAYLARSGWNNGGVRDQADLDKACELCADVCNNCGLKLYDYANLYKYKHNNNEESLLAVQVVPLGEWGTQNPLLSDLAFSSEVVGGVGAWGSARGTIDILEQYEPGDKIRLKATYMINGAHYDELCIKDGGYTYEGDEAPFKKGVPGGPDDDNDGYVAMMNSPLNIYLLRLADVYLTYGEAALGNKESLSEGEGLEYFNKVRQRAGLRPKSSISFDDVIRERRVEFALEYCNWYDMVSWYRWQPEKMLAYFNNQKRGWVAKKIRRNENGIFDFGPESDWTKVEPAVVITHNNVFLPYPEVDVIQNPLLKDEPQSYNFNEE